MFLLEEVLYFGVDLLFDGVNEVIKIVEIVLSELALVEVDVVEEVLSGLGEDRAEVGKAVVHLGNGVHIWMGWGWVFK
jgi:hypothetical protein